MTAFATVYVAPDDGTSDEKLLAVFGKQAVRMGLDVRVRRDIRFYGRPALVVLDGGALGVETAASAE